MSGQSHRNDSPVRNAQPIATWDRSMARQLVGWAARKAPPGLTQRLEEEWLADLAGRQGTFSRIRFGLGCCWATRIIAREFGTAAAAAGRSASGQRLLVAYGGYDFSRFSRRTVALIAIVCVHVGILYLYLTGFTPTIVVNPTDPTTGRVIIESRRPPHPTPLPSPTLTRTTMDTLPKPVLTIDFPPEPTAITVAHSSQPNVTHVQVPPEPVARVLGGPGAGFPATEEYYPPAMRRLGEGGAAAVRVCVDANGRLTADPAIVQSSGITQLDQGALRLARAGSGHYRPTTENGQPVSFCYAYRIVFRIEDP